MKISKIKTVFFSPTGTSKKIVNAIASTFGPGVDVEEVDLTFNTEDIQIAGDELAVFGVPVYAGRVATLAKERLKAIVGTGSPAVAVVLYGNREFEDALLEMRDIATAQSFNVISAAAFIGEHSFSSDSFPIGQGRPDEDDLKVASQFGAVCRKKIEELTDTVAEFEVPGDKPYKDGFPGLPFTPLIDQEKCNQCELCISTCPPQALHLEDELKIKVDNCIFCCACIKNCPEDAISIQAPPLKEKQEWLATNCKDRKEPSFFY